MDELKIIDLNQVCEITSLSRTMINKYRGSDRFPRAVPLGEKRIGFLKSEVLAWISDRVAERDRRAAA